MVYPQTGTTLYGPQGQNETRVSLSTNIIIKVGPNTVGAVQELSVNEVRTITMIDEVGTDGHIDGAPTKSTDITGSCKRIRFDRMRVAEALGRGFLHNHAQRIPFDLVIIDNWNGDGNSALVTTITGVWIESIAYSYTVSDWIVTDNMGWKAQAISTTLANTNAATGGTRNIPLAIDPIERAADIGLRRGSLDAPGLLQAFLPY